MGFEAGGPSSADNPVEKVMHEWDSKQNDTPDNIHFEFVKFEDPHRLIANKWYTIRTTQQPEPSGEVTHGRSGLNFVKVNGVTFNFKKSSSDGNGTSPSSGQIPKFFFSLESTAIS